MKIKSFFLAVPLAVIALLSIPTFVSAQTPTDFIVLHAGSDGLTYTRKQTRVITSQEEYNEAVVIYTSSPPLPIDFSKGSVLLVDMGPRPTGGYWVEVESVNSTMKGAVVVAVRLWKPGRRCLTTQALTNPFQFVFISSKQEILVSEKLATFVCPAPADQTDKGQSASSEPK